MNFNYNEYLEKARDLANQAYDQGVKALSKTETERKLADALSHANWGASTTQMADIAQATNDTQEYTVVMREVWAAIGEKPRNWRVVYKGLALLEFLLKHGSERCVREARDFKARVRGLETFSYSASGAEKGTGVREKARAIIELLSDADLLDTERRDAAKLRSKFTGVGRDGASVGPTGGTSTGGFGDVALSGARGAKLDSDSDDEYMAEQKRKMKKQQQQRKAGGGQEEQGEEDEEQDFGYNKPGKKNEDEDDFGFSSDEDKKPKPKAKKAGAKPPPPSDDEDDFGFSGDDAKPAPSKKAAAKASRDDEDDFGFDDKPALAPVKAGPIANISVKIPMGNNNKKKSSSSQQLQPPREEVDLFAPPPAAAVTASPSADWGAFSSPAPPPPAAQAPKPAAPAFDFFSFPPAQPAAPPQSAATMFPQPSFNMPPPAAAMQQQYQPQPGGFPNFAAQPQPGGGFPNMPAGGFGGGGFGGGMGSSFPPPSQQQFSMSAAPRGMSAPAPAAKKDAFAGLADLSIAAKPKKP